MLSIFRSKPLDQAFTVTKYNDLLSKTYKEILLYEIKANANSYTKNMRITERATKRYTYGVSLTTVAILVSIILLLSNKFITIEKVPAKVQVVNIGKIPTKNLVINPMPSKAIILKKK